MAIIAASLSVSAKAQHRIDIDQLVQASGSIVDTFRDGIAYVGGVGYNVDQGNIAETGSASSAYLTYEQASAYNNALQATTDATYTMTVQEYVDDAKDEAHMDFTNAVDSYIASSSVLIEAVVVNDMANEADATQDAVKAQEVQTYIASNDVEITEVHVDVYNDSLDAVEEAGQEYAAFVAVANDVEVMEQLTQEVAQQGEDFLNADTLMFEVGYEGQPTLVASFTTTSFAYIDVNLPFNYAGITQIYQDGYGTEFFEESPVGDCFFDPMACDNYLIEEPVPQTRPMLIEAN